MRLYQHSTDDYNIPNGAQTFARVNASMNQWLNGPKSPGLIILEHELYPQTVQVFLEHYPQMVSTGWEVISQAQMFDDDWFQNGTAQAPNVTNAAFTVSTPAPTSTSTSSSASGSTTAASQSGSASEAQGNGSNALKTSIVGSALAFVFALAFAAL